MAIDRSLDIANKIIAKLEAGNIPWRTVYGGGRKEGGYVNIHANPANIVSLRKYEGKNYFSALINIGLNGWTSGWFATYKQWLENDCVVKKGEKSTSICSWNESKEIDSSGNVTTEWRQKWFHVFNMSQVESVSENGKRFLELSREILSSHVVFERVPIEIVDQYGESYFKIPVLDSIPDALGCTFLVSDSYEASSYDYQKDIMYMPPMQKFISTDAYYATLFHECVHATMIRGRCDRHQTNEKLNGANYAREELVAEFASILLADYFGTVAVYLDNHAAYIQHWISALKAEPKYLMDVIGDAVKAKQFILSKLGVLKNGGKTKLETGDVADTRAKAEAECVPA